MCPAAHICCQLFCFYLSVFQTFVNITLCPHVGSFKTKELRSIINSANLPKQCNLRAFVAILILSQNTRFPRLRAAQISCLQAPRRILGPGNRDPCTEQEVEESQPRYLLLPYFFLFNSFGPWCSSVEALSLLFSFPHYL